MIHEDITLSGSFAISGSLILPRHASSDSATAATGSMYNDTTDNVAKIYTGTEWQVVGEQAGGSAGTNIEYLVVAGGGGGADGIGGGGGAGGYLSSSLSSIESGSTITVTVGAGGTGGDGSYGTNGANSSIASAAGTSFITVTSIGGGHGGYSTTVGDGGSGGGGSGLDGTYSGGSGTAGQGFDGGTGAGSAGLSDNRGGGGGGASEAGTGGKNITGNGGDGKQSSITGTATYYAGGGGGSKHPSAGSYGAGGLGGGGNGDVAGTANTGGGGGGSLTDGRAGGSGVVILAYPTGSMNGAGGIQGTTSAGRKYHQFNSSGTFKVSSTSDFELPQQNNLQLLWRADDYSSRGTSTWTDISGNSRNGTVSGASLNNNYYYSFDGSNDQIYNSSYYRSSGAQTLAIWMKFAGDGYNGYSLSGWQQSNSYNYMGRINSGNNLYYYIGANTGGTVSYSLSNDTWYLLTNTVDSSGNHNLYVDTTSRVSNSSISMGSGGSVPFRIGALGNSANYYHNGDIAIAAVWNTHLTSTEVAQLYNVTKTNFV